MPRATTRPSVLKDVPRPTPRLADALRSLSETQLQTQAARSAALDTGAIGVMSLDCALAAIVLGTQSTRGWWIAALMLLGLSFGLAMRALWIKGADNFGPFAVDLLIDRRVGESDRDLGWQLFTEVTMDVVINWQALADKTQPLIGATCLTGLAMAIDLIGLVR